MCNKLQDGKLEGEALTAHKDFDSNFDCQGLMICYVSVNFYLRANCSRAFCSAFQSLVHHCFGSGMSIHGHRSTFSQSLLDKQI